MTTKTTRSRSRKKSARSIYITEQDLERLTDLIDRYDGLAATPGLDALDEELGRAEVVPAKKIPKNVVTMNSRVRFADVETGEEREVTLVYPQDADAAQGRISILAPVGSALIGLSTGQTITWPMPNGRERKLEIREVLYQPEAAGDWDL